MLGPTELVNELRAMHASVGYPSTRRLESLAKSANLQLSRSTVSDVLSGRHAPSEVSVTALVEACRLHALATGQLPVGALWDENFRRLRMRRGSRPAGDAASAPAPSRVPPAPRFSPETRRGDLEMIAHQTVAATEALQTGLGLDGFHATLMRLEPVADRVAADASTVGQVELLCDYWRARTHFHRDADEPGRAIRCGHRALELSLPFVDVPTIRSLRRRVHDTVASAASSLRLVGVVDVHLGKAAELVETPLEQARVDLTRACCDIELGRYGPAAHRITDDLALRIVGDHGPALGAAALAERGKAQLLTKGSAAGVAVKDVATASDWLQGPTSEGPRVGQRIQWLETSILLGLRSGDRDAARDEADQLLELARLNGSHRNRVARVDSYFAAFDSGAWAPRRG